MGLFTEQIWCLDHGYVRLVDWMGSDLSVVNAAKVSFHKEANEMGQPERRLLYWLLRENEMSPFRHAFMTFELRAPLMVARQWWKYIVGSDHRDPMMAWNEGSRRYVTEEPEYYVPTWRQAPEHKKQGSGDFTPTGTSTFFRGRLRSEQRQSIRSYEAAIKEGIAPEQARSFLLGYGLYVTWRWSCSLQGCIHFLRQRLEDKAQSEIRTYADCVLELAEQHFPASLIELNKSGGQVKDPTNMEEYNYLYMLRTKLTGYGLDVKQHLPCAFCAAPEMFTLSPWEMASTWGNLHEEEHTCEHCGRSLRMTFIRDGEGSTMRTEQCGGPPQPEWLTPPMPLAEGFTHGG
jgi:thymidylate synthase (FAD)